jgi:hypothetical protein
MNGKQRKARCLAEMADIERRFTVTREFRDHANHWSGHDGRTHREARGEVTFKGECRTRDRMIADPHGNEFHVRKGVRVERRPTRIILKRPARWSVNGL